MLLETLGLSKSYEGIRAVSDVSLAIRAGEVHALVGENGAGKSTLVKMLGGLVRPDSGNILMDGRAVHLRGPEDALRNRIAVIHQELLPFPDLTVAENISMGREPADRFGWIDRRAMNEEARSLLARLGMSIDPRSKMGRLSIAEMQTVEIAKALGYRSRLIIMDEPTSALSATEVEALLALIRDLKRDGVSVIYISHRMDEIFRVPDRITVMRDGRVIATHAAAEMTESKLVTEMVGRELGALFPELPAPTAEVALEVRGIAGGDVTVRRGEVLGIAGLMGAGRTELVSAIAAKELPGVAMVTEDRKQSGIIPEMSVAHNITLAALKQMCSGPFLSGAAETKAVREQTTRLAIKCSSPAQKISRLSGGNQQKALLARALLTDPDVLILDEPTRGIDVGAKSEVYAIIAELARSGKAIIMVSSEMPEILALSHRILVMREGRICAELNAKQTTAEEVLACAMPQ